MKHLKLFENKSVSTIRNAINVYQSFIAKIKPAVFEKYNKLVDTENYEPEYGDMPHGYADDNFFYISDIIDLGDGFEFFLTETDKHGNIEANYQVTLTDEEIEDAYMKIDAKKYNL